MRRFSRIVLLAALTALTPALAGCENIDFDKLDFLGLSQKKKLPGERKPLFPEGVPGVSQGIPNEYQKSYVEQQQLQQQNDSALSQPATGPAEKKTAAAQPAEKPKPKPKSKPKRTVKHKAKPKPKPSATAAAPANANQATQQQSSPWPAPGQQQQQQSSPWPASGQQQQSPWPSPPPPDTFSR